MWCIVFVVQQWKAGVSYWIWFPARTFQRLGMWGWKRVQKQIPDCCWNTGGSRRKSCCIQPVRAGNCSPFPPFSFTSSACAWLCKTQWSTMGEPQRGNLLAGLRQTQVAPTAACSLDLDLAKLRGLGHLTVLSAQAGRDNGIFNRLPVCSDRKLLMSHFKLLSRGKCANSPSKHLICLLFAHSTGSLKGWQFSPGHGSTCISHCQGPLKDPCALLFSRAPFFCPSLGTMGTAALEVGTVAGSANIPCIIPPLALSPTPPRPVMTDSSQFLELASNLEFKTWKFCAVPTSPEIASLMGLPHPTAHLIGFTQHKEPFGDFSSGQLPRDPEQRKSQRSGKDPFSFQLLLRTKKASDRDINCSCLSGACRAMPENNSRWGPEWLF